MGQRHSWGKRRENNNKLRDSVKEAVNISEERPNKDGQTERKELWKCYECTLEVHRKDESKQSYAVKKLYS